MRSLEHDKTELAASRAAERARADAAIAECAEHAKRSSRLTDLSSELAVLRVHAEQARTELAQAEAQAAMWERRHVDDTRQLRGEADRLKALAEEAQHVSSERAASDAAAIGSLEQQVDQLRAEITRLEASKPPDRAVHTAPSSPQPLASPPSAAASSPTSALADSSEATLRTLHTLLRHAQREAQHHSDENARMRTELDEALRLLRTAEAAAAAHKSACERLQRADAAAAGRTDAEGRRNGTAVERLRAALAGDILAGEGCGASACCSWLCHERVYEWAHGAGECASE